MQADPKKMAAHLKELGPDKAAEALCAAFAALAPLCKQEGGALDGSEPAAPRNMADLGAQAAQAYGDRSKGGSSW